MLLIGGLGVHLHRGLVDQVDELLGVDVLERRVFVVGSE